MSDPKSIDEIFKLVKESDPLQDWHKVYHGLWGESKTAVFKRDVNLRIETVYGTPADLHCENFSAEWATSFPDPHAESHYYNLYYGATILKSFILVTVDGGRACLPLPINSSIDLEVRCIDHKVALIFDPHGDCKEYMKRAGLYVRALELAKWVRRVGRNLVEA